jgi:hypothetical protein
MCSPTRNPRFRGPLIPAPRIVLPALAVLAFAAIGHAATYTISVETSDQVLTSSGSARFVGDSVGRVGNGYGNTEASAMVLPFKLPNLAPEERVYSATLSVNLEGWTNTYFTLRNIDLYGIDLLRTTNAANQPGNYVNGTNPAGNSNAHLLHDNLFVPSDTSGASGSGASITKVSSDFGEFVDSLYTTGTAANRYAFLTLAHDAALSQLRYYTLSSANSTTKPKPIVTLLTGTARYLNAQSGNDGNPGTAASPWQTWNHAQSKLKPGETLYCTGTIGLISMYATTGTHGLNAYAVGTPIAPIFYKRWPGQAQPKVTRLVFDGVKRDTHLSFEGFEFSPGRVTDGNYSVNTAIYLAGAWHISFKDCDVIGAQLDIPDAAFSGTGGVPLSFSPYTPNSPHSNPAITSGVPGNASYVTIRDSRIRNCGIGIMVSENEAYSTKFSRNWQILDNDIWNVSEDCLRFAGWDAGANSVVRGNQLHDQSAYQAAFMWYGFSYKNGSKDRNAFAGLQWARMKQDVTNDTGLFYYVTELNATNGWARIYIIPDDRNAAPTRNTSHPWRLISDSSTYFQPRNEVDTAAINGDSCHTDCIAVMGQMTGGLFEKNKVEAAPTGGGVLKIENIPRKISSNPDVYENRHPNGIVFRNNLFYAKANPEIKAALLIIAGGKDVYFVNNTIFAGPHYHLANAMRFIDTQEDDGAGFENVYFYGNIIGGGGNSNIANGPALGISDYNVWMSPPVTGANQGILNGPHDLLINPAFSREIAIAAMGFVDAANGDLRITAGSPAQSKGMEPSGTIPIPADDFDGWIRDSFPDAGAYEVH